MKTIELPANVAAIPEAVYGPLSITDLIWDRLDQFFVYRSREVSDSLAAVFSPDKLVSHRLIRRAGVSLQLVKLTKECTYYREIYRAKFLSDWLEITVIRQKCDGYDWIHAIDLFGIPEEEDKRLSEEYRRRKRLERQKKKKRRRKKRRKRSEEIGSRGYSLPLTTPPEWFEGTHVRGEYSGPRLDFEAISPFRFLDDRPRYPQLPPDEPVRFLEMEITGRHVLMDLEEQMDSIWSG